MSRLVLIDGNAILHRAYHALPPLTNRNGQQVNAVYGFASILLRILDELKPEYLAVAFDRPEPTFRKQEYIGYQSKRKEMDVELVGQVDLVHELVESYGVQIFEKAGFEADDVIGTIARKVTDDTKIQGYYDTRKGNNIKNKNHSRSIEVSQYHISTPEVVIVTGDRDLMQLVNDKVKLYMPTRGMSEGEMVDTNAVRVRLGVLPEQIVDYKALVGDSSDNYPGVPGIGPKTAVELIREFGGFNSIYEQNFDDSANVGKPFVRVRQTPPSTSSGSGHDGLTKVLPPRANEPKPTFNLSTLVKQKLIDGKESGELSYRLATIKTDVDVELNLDRLKVEELNKEGLQEFFRQMNFRSLLKRVEGGQEEKGEEKKRVSKKINEDQQTLF